MAEEQSYIGKYLMGYSLTLGPLLEFKGMGQINLKDLLEIAPYVRKRKRGDFFQP